MISRAALLSAALLLVPAARAAADPAAYDAKVSPLDDLSKELLTVNGYELRDDGKVWDKIAETPVALDDMPYLLSRLASAKRLRALLEINNIINRYDAERNLAPEDKEAVRDLVRQNWIVFGAGPRNDFRSYFSAEELAALDQIPPRFEAMGATTLTDPAVESVTALPPPAVSTIPAAAAPMKAIPALTPLTDFSALPRAALEPAAPAPTPAAVAPSSAPAPSHVVTSNFTAVPAAPPKLPEIVPPPAAPSIAAAASALLGTLKPWTPPPGSALANLGAPKPAPVAVSTPAAPASAAAPPPPPEPPKPAVIGEPEYEKFVAEGPYDKAGKEALELLGKRAPDYCLPLLRRTVVGAVPQIVVDGSRAGAELRAGFSRDAADPLAPAVVVLSPGPVFVEVKSGFLGPRQAVLLPESPRFWKDLGVERPALDALRQGAAPASAGNGEWGAERVYADGSRRGSYSAMEMDGELLEQLLLLGLAREGLDASEYAARRWARAARLMFEARIKDETRRDDFLDPDRRAELRVWLDEPDEDGDVSAAVWSGSRLQRLDPRRGPPASTLEFEARARTSCGRAALEDALAENSRRRAARVGELETLLDAGLASGAAAKSAAQAATDAEALERSRLLAAPPECPAPNPAREEGLRKAVLLLAESARAERLMREHRAGIEGHAL